MAATVSPGSRSGDTVTGLRRPGRHALFSPGTPGAGRDRSAGGLFRVSCSSCGSVSCIGLLELVRCMLPAPLWLPRRAFDRWMTCPACRRRTWTSLTLVK